MLRVFHTADWHLGQSFCGYDRDFEHGRFLDWLLQQLQERRPDALLLAGDVFDSVNPSAAAQRRYFRFLARAREVHPQLQMVLIAGNHDAPSRLEAPADLLDAMQISVIGTVGQDAAGQIDVDRFLVTLRDTQSEVRAIVMAVPFLRPADVPYLADADDPYLEGIRELYRRTLDAAVQKRDEQHPQAAIIAMGHCHLHGGSESPDSERRLVVGGSEAVRVETFGQEIAYVALGHLHRAQSFDEGRIRYSGSPIPLSFAEVRYPHQIQQLTFERQQLASTEAIDVPRAVPLLRIPSSSAEPLDSVLRQLETLSADPQLPPDQQPFLEVRVREDGPDPTRRQRVEQALQGKPVRLGVIKVERAARDTLFADEDEEQPDMELLDQIQPEDVFCDAWREKYGTEPDSAVMSAFREVLLQEPDGQ